MEFDKFISYRKENALAKLADEGFTRFFVEDVAKSSPPVKSFLHVKICRKDRANNFIVSEVPVQNKILNEDAIILSLENGFAAKDVLLKLTAETELIIKGFKIVFSKGEICQVIVCDRNKVASIWYLRCQALKENIAATNPNEIYDYTKLTALSARDKVNLFGVVKKSKRISSKGDDQKASLFLTDDSIGFDKEIEFIVSSKKSEDLDKINPMDIVRLHRATIEPTFLSPTDFKGFGSVGTKGFHFLTFNGDLGSDLNPRTSSLSHTLSDADIERVQQLRNWSAEFFQPDNDGPECYPLCRFVRAGSYQDLLIQVIAIGSSQKQFEPVVIRGWDGTKIGLENLNKMRDFRTETDKVISIDDNLHKFVEDLSLAVDVFVYDEFREPASKVQPGEIIKLGNVHAAIPKDSHSKIPSLVLHGSRFSDKGRQHGRGFWILNPRSRPAVQLKTNLAKFTKDLQPGTSGGSPANPLSESFDDSFDKILLAVDDCVNRTTYFSADSSSPAAKRPREQKNPARQRTVIAVADRVEVEEYDDSDDSAIYSQTEERIVSRVSDKSKLCDRSV